MKLAEALQERADLNKKIEQLRSRITSNALMQEGVLPVEDPEQLLKAEVIQTYVYNQTFNSGGIPNYGYTTAVGLFKSLVGCVLVLICNYISKKVRNGRGIV